MDDAVNEYIAARSTAHAWILGRFIVPASRLDELAAKIREEPFAVSVIADVDRDARRWFESARAIVERVAERRRTTTPLHIEALETRLPALERRRDTHDAAIGQLSALIRSAQLGDLPSYVELPASRDSETHIGAAMRAFARHGLGAKIRCGGGEPHAVPPPSEVARFLYSAAGEHVRYKATAGLHHPVRHIDEASGVAMHGFFNVLAAAFAAQRGASPDVLVRMLEEEDARAFAFDEAAFRWRDWHADVTTIDATRREGLAAYGSCSFNEPIEDLTTLRLL